MLSEILIKTDQRSHSNQRWMLSKISYQTLLHEITLPRILNLVRELVSYNA